MFQYHRYRKQFTELGFVIVKNIYDVRNHSQKRPDLFEYVKQLPPSSDDEQTPGAPAYYKETEVNKVHIKLLEKIERITGFSLYPTYGYMRIYNGSSILKRHSDREACEIGCTLNVGYEGEYNWPIHIEDYQKKSHRVVLEPGDALIYRGYDLPHWREQSDGLVKKQAQIFLHYVDREGPFADHIYDIIDDRKRRLCT